MRIIKNKQIKVAYIDHAEEMGGAEFSLYYLIKEIDRGEVKPHLIVPSSSPLKDRFSHDQNVTVTHHPLGSINPLKRPSNIISFLKGVRNLTNYFKTNIDVIHTNTYRASIYGLIAGKLAKKTTIWHVRDLHNSFFFKHVMPLFADHIVAISRAVSEQFSDNVMRKKVSIVYNGVDFSEYQPQEIKAELRQELNIGKSTTLIGMVGRMTKWKGYHHLIEALPQIIAHDPNVKIVIVGDALFAKQDYLTYLKKRVKEKNLSEYVVFLGQREDIPNIMKSLDLFVSFSDREPFGRVIIEALAMETPVIVANSGGAPEIIENGNCGTIVEDGDAGALGLSIIALLNRKNELSSLGINGRRWVEAKFDTRKVGTEITQTYSKVTLMFNVK